MTILELASNGSALFISILVASVMLMAIPFIILYYIIKFAVKNGMREALREYDYKRIQQQMTYKEAQEKARQAEGNTSKTPKPESIQDMLFKK